MPIEGLTVSPVRYRVLVDQVKASHIKAEAGEVLKYLPSRRPEHLTITEAPADAPAPVETPGSAIVDESLATAFGIRNAILIEAASIAAAWLLWKLAVMAWRLM